MGKIKMFLKIEGKMPTTILLILSSWSIAILGLAGGLAWSLSSPIRGISLLLGSVAAAAALRMLGNIGEIMHKASYDLKQMSYDLKQMSCDLKQMSCDLKQLSRDTQQIGCDTKDINQCLSDIRKFFESIERHLDLKK